MPVYVLNAIRAFFIVHNVFLFHTVKTLFDTKTLFFYEYTEKGELDVNEHANESNL
ncbi:hypothetical protein FHS15_004074 [Paenibacillus castaneae]|nr:hypothetical protein [Paenibacillus castaneae]